MGGTPVGISVIRPSELGPTEITAWHDMQRMTPALANPFLSPEFTIAVGRVRPTSRVAVLAEGRDITGFLPFELRRFGVGVPIATGLTDCQGLVHAPGADWDARALLSACRISTWHFDHLVSGQKPFQRYQSALAPSPVIDLSGGFDAYYASLKASTPSFCPQLRRKGRKLEREVGEIRFVADSRDVRDLRTLMAWKSDQYRRTGRLDRFSSPWIVELLDSLLETRTSGLTGALSVLYADEAPVAAHFGLQSNSIMAYWFPAYDNRLGKYSPGLLHTLRFVEESAATGVQLIDLGKGAKRYKETLKSRDLFVAEGIVTRPSVTAVAHWARKAPQAWLIRQIRAHPPLFHAADALLRRGAQVRNSLPSRTATLHDPPAGKLIVTVAPDRSKLNYRMAFAIRHPDQVVPFVRRVCVDAWLRARSRDHVSYYRAVMRHKAARSLDLAVGSRSSEQGAEFGQLGAIFDFTFYRTDDDGYQVHHEDFYYRAETLITLAAKYQLSARLMDDWLDPWDKQAKIRITRDA